MNTHVFWLVLIIICAVAFVAAFVYNKELEKLGGQTQGIIWILICFAFIISIIYYGRS